MLDMCEAHAVMLWELLVQLTVLVLGWSRIRGSEGQPRTSWCWGQRWQGEETWKVLHLYSNCLLMLQHLLQCKCSAASHFLWYRAGSLFTSVWISSQGSQGPPGLTGPVGAPGLGLQGEKVKTAGTSAKTEAESHILTIVFSYQHLQAALVWFVLILILFLAGRSRPSWTRRLQRTPRYWNNRTKGETGGGRPITDGVFVSETETQIVIVIDSQLIVWLHLHCFAYFITQMHLWATAGLSITRRLESVSVSITRQQERLLVYNLRHVEISFMWESVHFNVKDLLVTVCKQLIVVSQSQLSHNTILGRWAIMTRTAKRVQSKDWEGLFYESILQSPA